MQLSTVTSIMISEAVSVVSMQAIHNHNTLPPCFKDERGVLDLEQFLLASTMLLPSDTNSDTSESWSHLSNNPFSMTLPSLLGTF